MLSPDEPISSGLSQFPPIFHVISIDMTHRTCQTYLMSIYLLIALIPVIFLIVGALSIDYGMKGGL